MQVDRQTLVFFIIMFILLSLPNTGEEPHSTKDKEALKNFEQTTQRQVGVFQNATWESGYGEIDGFLLSYEDSLKHKNISEWPFHEFDDEHPWKEDEKYSIIPNSVSDKLKSFWGVNRTKQSSLAVTVEDEKSYLLNISGVATGKFHKGTEKYKVEPMNIPMPEYLQEYAKEYTDYRRSQDSIRYDDDGNPIDEVPPISDEPPQRRGNVTFSSGEVVFAISNSDYNFKDPETKNLDLPEDQIIDDAVLTDVTFFIRDDEQSEEHRVDTQGIYFQDLGGMVFSTTTAKFISGFAFPHLTIYESLFNKSKILVEQYYETRQFKKVYSMDTLNGFVIDATDCCEYVGYVQFEKTKFTKEELREIDDELKFPTGKPITKDLPKLVVSDYMLYSPDCGIIIEKPKETVFHGDLMEVYERNGRMFLRGLFCLLTIQLLILLKQIKQIKTPGQLSNISSTTVSLFGFQDSLIALIFLLATTIFRSSYLSLVSVSVLAFFMSGVFEMRFLVNVLTNQQNERGISWWEILRGSTTSGTDREEGGPTNNTTQPEQQPTTTAQPATVGGGEFIETDEARISNGLFARTFFFTIVSVFLILNAVSWRKSYRRTFEIICVLFINSYWFPQFLRNTLKNRRKSFSWDFIIITSILRAAPIFYINISGNVFRHRQNDFVELALLSFWLLLQISLLYLQEILGARFWINDKWLPKAFDYHPILNVTDLENGFSSDILANIRELRESDGDSEGDEGKGVVTCKVGCTICMNDIDLPVIVQSDPKSKNAAGSVNASDRMKSQQYMITPCHHIFHTECLEDWMKYKLQCPVCRSSLPPV